MGMELQKRMDINTFMDNRLIMVYDKIGNTNPNWKGGVTFKICIRCGMNFRGSRVSLYCSKSCFDNSLKTGEDTVCVLCGKTFYSSPSLKRKYCSLECAYKSPTRMPKTKITLNCFTCSKQMEVNQYKLKTQKFHFCSRHCKHEYMRNVWIRPQETIEKQKEWWTKRIFALAQSEQAKDVFMHSQNYRKVVFGLLGKKLCELCDRDGFPDFINFDVHHKDHNRRNNHYSNLMLLCRSCHLKYHKNGGDGLS